MNTLEATFGFNLSTLAILLLSGSFYRRSNAVPLKKYSIIYAMIWVVALSSVCSILGALIENDLMQLQLIIGQLYLMAHIFLTLLTLLYTASLTDYCLSNRKQLLPWLIPFPVFFIMLFFPRQFLSLNVGGKWIRGSFAWLNDLLFATVCAGMGIFLFRGWKTISRKERVFACVLLYVIAVVPSVSVPRADNFLLGICLLLWQMAVPGPQQLTDSTTGLMNVEGLSALLSPALLQKKAFPLGFLMVDNFYELKNTYGYAYLRPQISMLADFLKTHEGVVLARVDRGLFCFVPANFQPNAGWEALLRDLEEDTLSSRLHQRSTGPQLQVKVGVVSCPQEADSMEGLRDLYDLASRRRFPKGRIVLRLNERDLLDLLRRRQVELLVRTAVEDGCVSMEYQPIYNVHTGRFCGAEALMRIHSKELGDLSPVELIPIAKETGSILQLSHFAIDTVCQVMRNQQWDSLGLDWITVNLSATDLAQEGFLPRLLGSLRRTETPPRKLGLELSEGTFNAMPTGQVSTLEALEREGICIVLDEFGSDGCSLNHLCVAPVDIVKLDQSLLQRANTPQGLLALENAICMVQRLNKAVLAEGVETKEQADWLISHGIDFMQGFYYARPMDARSLEGFLKNQ